MTKKLNATQKKQLTKLVSVITDVVQSVNASDQVKPVRWLPGGEGCLNVLESLRA